MAKKTFVTYGSLESHYEEVVEQLCKILGKRFVSWDLNIAEPTDLFHPAKGTKKYTSTLDIKNMEQDK